MKQDKKSLKTKAGSSILKNNVCICMVVSGKRKLRESKEVYKLKGLMIMARTGTPFASPSNLTLVTFLLARVVKFFPVLLLPPFFAFPPPPVPGWTAPWPIAGHRRGWTRSRSWKVWCHWGRLKLLQTRICGGVTEWDDLKYRNVPRKCVKLSTWF